MKLKLSLKSLLPPGDFGWNHTRARCALHTCHNKLLMRSVPQHRAGVHVGPLWYCSVDCFVSAARMPLARLSLGRIVEMPRNPRLSLGLAMLAKGYLSEEQLRLASERSQWTGDDMETTLLQLGLADEKRLAGARAAQWGYPVFVQDRGGQVVAADLPRSVLESFAAVPLHYSLSPRRLVLGFVHRVEHSLLQSIEQVTGFRPEPCFITPTELEEQTGRVVPFPDYEEIVVEDPGSPAQMARSLGSVAVDVGAREVTFAQCKSWVWVRIAGKRRVADVLFPLKTAAPVEKGRESTLLRETIGSLG